MADQGQSYPPLPYSVRVGESPSRTNPRCGEQTMTSDPLRNDRNSCANCSGGNDINMNSNSNSNSSSNHNSGSAMSIASHNKANDNNNKDNNSIVVNNSSPGEEEEDDDPFTIGEKLEYFYLCLVEKQRKDFPADCELAHIDTHTDTQTETETAIDFDKSLAQSELHYLAHSLALLETHAPIHRLRETRELVEEVAKDVRRKAAAHIRAPYIEPLNALITQCRKRLQTKTALGLQSGGNVGIAMSSNVEGNDHGQRYLYVLMDLLGSFSDIVRELSLCSLSLPTLQAVLAPLYDRVRETCVQSVSCYERDRDILALSQRSCDVNCHLEVSLHSLDAVAAQLGAMKRVLVTHYLFLAHSFAHYFAQHESEDDDTLCGERTAHTTRAHAHAHAHSYPYLDRLLIVSTEEVLHWRELDFLYSTCESNYFLHAILEACGNNALVEVEGNAFLPQAIEDAVFLLYKCVERASLSLDEHTLCDVAHKLLEMLLPPPEFRDNSTKYLRLNAAAQETSGGFLWRAMYGEETRTHTHAHAQRETETHPALLYALVTESALYRGCCTRRRHALSERVLCELASLCTGRDLPLSHTDTQTHKVEKALFREEQSSPLKPTPSLTDSIQQISTEDMGNIADFAALSAWGEAVSGKVSEGVSSVVSQWWSSYYATEEDESTSRDRIEKFRGESSASDRGCVTPLRETASESEREREKLLTARPQRPSHSHSHAHAQAHTLTQSSSLAHTHTAAAPSTPLRDTHTETEKELSMEAMLLQALDIREGNDDRERGDDYEEEDEEYSADLFAGNKHGKGVQGGALRSVRDWAVRVNAAAALTHAVQWTTRTLGSAQDAVFPYCIERSMSSRAKSKMEGLVNEFRLCCRVYEQWLTDELTHFLLSRRQAHTLRDTLSLFLGRSYVLTGQEMEDRWHNHLLHYCVSLWLAQCPLPPTDAHTQPPAHKDTTDAAQETHTAQHALANNASQDESTPVSVCVSWLSLRARRTLLRTLSGIIADIVYRECVMQRDFNEWGALLLYEEVQDATKHLENLIQETNTGVDDDNERVTDTTSDRASVCDENESERSVRRLHWACKLLTLDSPADLRRYNALLDSVLSLFSEGESELRSVLSRRVDFSRDAVKNVPLRFSAS